ncbi:sulfurtransferase [Sapientia aquatica]|uniref:tRNA uridine(34) hydroxylase n=1 Tax=Sapientia aquatica TaxID=1549640 RepID=A0A4R5W0F2_9BURK|nr:sulfurtransferase [Sapientia aquatica]TDK64442.1 sulfurtransferase [Sapientia aquatica]
MSTQSSTPQNVPPYVNISAYKFITFNDTAEKRPEFLAICQKLNLKGTILLTPEGINLFLAGLRHEIDGFMDWLHTDPRFSDVVAKESFSDSQPFTKLLVKLKAETITMRMPLIRPEDGRAPFVTPPTLKRWLDQGHDDEGRPVVMVDTRNDFEVDVGSFDNTIDFRIKKFTEFPAVIAENKDKLNDKTVVTFCTGGIRCEKAAIHMQNVGYEHVYQLEGGILKYFEEVGGAHYHGDCFVFDYRTALNPQLEATDTEQCYACRAVVTPREQLSPYYIPGKSCPHCKKQCKPEAPEQTNQASESA